MTRGFRLYYVVGDYKLYPYQMNYTKNWGKEK